MIEKQTVKNNPIDRLSDFHHIDFVKFQMLDKKSQRLFGQFRFTDSTQSLLIVTRSCDIALSIYRKPDNRYLHVLNRKYNITFAICILIIF